MHLSLLHLDFVQHRIVDCGICFVLAFLIYHFQPFYWLLVIFCKCHVTIIHIADILEQRLLQHYPCQSLHDKLIVVFHMLFNNFYLFCFKVFSSNQTYSLLFKSNENSNVFLFLQIKLKDSYTKIQII